MVDLITPPSRRGDLLQADIDACDHEAEKKSENQESDVHVRKPSCVDAIFIATTEALQADGSPLSTNGDNLDRSRGTPQEKTRRRVNRRAGIRFKLPTGF
jgi:hypothetical protein